MADGSVCWGVRMNAVGPTGQSLVMHLKHHKNTHVFFAKGSSIVNSETVAENKLLARVLCFFSRCLIGKPFN